MKIQCNKCHEDKIAGDFYASNKSECKECIKARARENRSKNIERVRAYDRERSTTKARLAHISRNTSRWRSNNPERYKAHTAVSNALRAGKLTKEPCLVCRSEKSHAHHEDYLRPLNVVWLCAEHHQQYHLVRRVAEKVLGQAST